MQRLLVSVRGPKEAISAVKGGCHIADVEYPASALGTPYPLNILSVRQRLNEAGFRNVAVSTNIGEMPQNRANACQAALGVATAGANLIKFGLAELPLDAAIYQAQTIIRSVRKFYIKVKLCPAIFVDKALQRFLKPFEEGLELVRMSKANGILIDTFEKSIGMGLLDYCTITDISKLAKELHAAKKQIWVAGSISLEEAKDLWDANVDVICVRSAACKPAKGPGRFGRVDKDRVAQLVDTIPKLNR